MNETQDPVHIQLCPRGEMARSWDARPRYFWEAPAGVTLEMVQRPDYWREVSRFFKQRWVVVEVVSVSGEWECSLSAVEVRPDGGVEMRLTSAWQQDGEDLPDLPEGYAVQLNANGWAVFDHTSSYRDPVATGVVTERKARELARADFDKRNAFVSGRH